MTGEESQRHETAEQAGKARVRHTQETAAKAVNASWYNFHNGGRTEQLVGVPATMSWPKRITNSEAAVRATSFRGKKQPGVAAAIASGDYMASAAAYTQSQIEKRWADQTRKTKGKVLLNSKISFQQLALKKSS